MSEHNEQAHAILGASGAKMWMSCPGSIRLRKELGFPDTKSFYAREGTAAHEVAAKCLLNGMDPEFYVGKKVEGVKVTREMAAAVRVYVDKVRLIAESVNHEITTDNVEVMFSLEDIDPPEEMFGTCDYAQYDELRGKHLWIIDYKHGAGVAVEAEENPQLMYYALGAILKMKIQPRNITVVIVQPRCAHPDGIVRDWTFDWERLMAFKEDLMVAAYETQNPDAGLAVGDWCRFCPALSHCPAQHENAVVVAQQEFPTMAEDKLPAPHILSEDELAEVLDKADMVIKWLKSVQQYAHEELESNREVPGWKLVPKRANRKWIDEDEVRELIMQEMYGVESEDIHVTKLLSPNQMEIKLRQFGHELPDGLTTRTPSGYNMVRGDDPRDAAVILDGSEFPTQ